MSPYEDGCLGRLKIFFLGFFCKLKFFLKKKKKNFLPFHRSHCPAAGGHDRSHQRAEGPPHLALGSDPWEHQTQMNVLGSNNTIPQFT